MPPSAPTEDYVPRSSDHLLNGRTRTTAPADPARHKKEGKKRGESISLSLSLSLYIYIYIHTSTGNCSNRSWKKKNGGERGKGKGKKKKKRGRKYQSLSLSLSLYIYIYIHTYIRIHTYTNNRGGTRRATFLQANAYHASQEEKQLMYKSTSSKVEAA